MLTLQNLKLTRRGSFASLVALGFMLGAASCSSNDDNAGGGPPAGGDGAACYPNGTCMAGLRCVNAKCMVDNLTQSDGGGVGPGQTQPGGPRFLAFASNVKTIGTGESVTLTAVLTDPDGVDDVIGGTLKEGDATYGAFVTSGQEGAYQMAISWADINKVKPIAFAMRTDGTRTLTAEFYDTAGHVAKADFTLALTCKGLAACNGSCTDTDSTEGNCVALENCMKTSAASPTTCNAICAAKGKKCYPGSVGSYYSTCPSSPAYSVDCTIALPGGTGGSNPFKTVSCMCSQ
ncbi:hypothetical protein [Pendulispora albinea]|uniref:Lipoprotein n=1 Tax=Pendulispora albinea TaxID=2741071 RepID=A0ABZ2M1V7_9BACT